MDPGLREGAVIAEKYRLVSLLGEGGMGVVWAAEHVVTRRKVALKILRPRVRRGRPADTRVRERALREARASVAVGDPRVLPIDDVLEHEGDVVLVMDRLDGETLRARIDRDTKLAWGDARPLLVALAEAVVAAHGKGVVHRDLKPDNVFLLARATADVPLKVLDFGIAKLGREVLDDVDTPLTTTGAMLGTPVYMSPEQGFGESDIDARSDAWSFGVLAHELLAGSRPVGGDNLGQVLKAISRGSRPPLAGKTDAPDAVCRAVDALLVSDREARGTLAAFLEAARSPREVSQAPPLARAEGSFARSVGTATTAPAPRAAGRALLAVSAAAGAAAVVALGLVLARGGTTASAPPSPAPVLPAEAPPAASVKASAPASAPSEGPLSPPNVASVPASASQTPKLPPPAPTKAPIAQKAAPAPAPADDRGPAGVVVKPPF